MIKYQYLQEHFKRDVYPGNEEYKLERKDRFGGSEIGSILNLNPYIVSIEEFLYSRCIDIQTIPMKFGKIFEIVAKKWLEEDKKIEILPFNTVICSFLPLSYTPDGLIIKGSNLHLLEIKCPIYKQNMKDILVDPNYLAQIQTGLNILPVDSCMFCVFKFRICSLGNCLNDNNRFNKPFHYGWADKTCSKPLFTGILYWDEDCDLIDYGLYQSSDFDKFNDLTMNFKIYLNATWPNNNKGKILPFKCFDYKDSHIQQDPSFLYNRINVIWDIYSKWKQYEFQKEPIEEEEGVILIQKK